MKGYIKMYYAIIKNKNGTVKLNTYSKNKICTYSLDFLSMEYYKISNKIYKFTNGKIKINFKDGYYPKWDNRLKMWSVKINQLEIWACLMYELIQNVESAKYLKYI